MQALTDIQQAVLDYTRRAVREGEPFPSLRKIAAHFGFQHTTARFHLKALEKKGYIRRRSQRVSDYMLSEVFDPDPRDFNLVARIPAGTPLQMFDEAHEALRIDHDFFGGGDILALRVIGDSMSGDAINDGDIAMIKPQQEAGKNDILALRIGDELTLKRLRTSAANAHLLSSNPDHPERVVAARDVEILGKLVGIIRKV